MPDKRISDLTGVSSVNQTDQLPVVQSPGSETKKTTVAQLFASAMQSGAGIFTAPTSIVTVPFSYVIGSERLKVYLNGQLLRRIDDYAETTTTSVTLVDTLSSSDKVDFIYI